LKRTHVQLKAMKSPAVYIMANKRNGTLYTGVTSNLSRRAWEHRDALVPGFTARYGCKLLVRYEFHDSMPGAIAGKANQGGLAQEKADAH
jgi:predicted GIY-YIG superfamily endonuclease